MKHYVPAPAAADAARNRRLVVAVCGEIDKGSLSFTTNPRRVECPECRRLMVSEERDR